jgi:hypothetical protein
MIMPAHSAFLYPDPVAVDLLPPRPLNVSFPMPERRSRAAGSDITRNEAFLSPYMTNLIKRDLTHELCSTLYLEGERNSVSRHLRLDSPQCSPVRVSSSSRASPSFSAASSSSHLPGSQRPLAYPPPIDPNQLTGQMVSLSCSSIQRELHR